jgi:hypothetical protein
VDKVVLPPKLAYSITQACRMTGISRSWLYKQWAAGRGPRRFKAGSRIMPLVGERGGVARVVRLKRG